MSKVKDNKLAPRNTTQTNTGRQMTRSSFLRCGAAAMAGLCVNRMSTDTKADAVKGPLVTLKGKKESRVKSWHIITIGNLSRNRYWSESDDRGVRAAICTCTVIVFDGFHLIVDPSLADAKEMASELNRRTGLKLSDIDTVFITHLHGDHHRGLAQFPQAKWLAGNDVAAAITKSKRYIKAIKPAGKRIHDAIDVMPTPGHTMDHHSLRFDCAGLSVAIAGDAVATRDFWRERRGYFNAVDFELSARTMDRIAAIADVVVPGHDNYFVNLHLA
ncbi:MAG: MBL fold metallo-hydrolase [Planctomycetota bacterium]